MMRNRSKSKITLGVLTVCVAALSSLALASQPQQRAAVFTQDKGKFTIQLDGQTVGHEEFEISPADGGWAARGTTDLKVPDSPASRVTGTLTLQPDGAPISYEWSSHAEKTNGAHILFANGVAKITLQMQGARPFEQDMTFNTPLIAVLDNNLYYQYAVLARVYDWSKRGAQNLPVLIPQELTPGSVTVDSTGSVSAKGKSYDGLRVTTSDVEVLLYLDSNHRLMRLEVPAAKVSVVRD
jgi:phage baseplate assembly protein gpV